MKLLESVSPVLNILKNQKEVVMFELYSKVRVTGGSYSITAPGSEGFVQSNADSEETFIMFDHLKSKSGLSGLGQCFDIRTTCLEPVQEAPGQIVYALYHVNLREETTFSIVGVYHLLTDAENKLREASEKANKGRSDKFYIAKLSIE